METKQELEHKPEEAKTETAAVAEAPKSADSLEERIARIEKNVARQTTIARLRFCTSLLGLAVLVVALLAVGMKVFPLLDQVSGTLTQVNATIEGMKLEEMSKSVTDLATTGAEGVNEALKQVDAAMQGVSSAIQVVEGLDIQGLNDGITKLNEVMEPLAKFFGRK